MTRDTDRSEKKVAQPEMRLLSLGFLSPLQTAGRPIRGAYAKALDRMSNQNGNPSRCSSGYNPGKHPVFCYSLPQITFFVTDVHKLRQFLHASIESSFARFCTDKRPYPSYNFLSKAIGATSSYYTIDEVVENFTYRGIAQRNSSVNHLTTSSQATREWKITPILISGKNLKVPVRLRGAIWNVEGIADENDK